MKKTMIALVLLLLFTAPQAFAVDEHHPADGAPANAQAQEPAQAQTDGKTIQEADASIQRMEELRKKMLEAKTPAERRKLRQEHMAEMRQGMQAMMGMGMEMGMGQKGMGPMMMERCMGMMEKRMEMMQEMMQGMMDHQEMTMQGK